jgi:hypothetical protein
VYRAGIRSRISDELINLTQIRPGEQCFLVGDPLGARGQHRMRRLRRRLGDEPGALSQPSVRSMVHPCVAERPLSPVPPDSRCPLAQRHRVVRCGQPAAQHTLDGQFGEYEIRGDAREVKHQRLDAEPAFARRVDLAVNDVQVTVVHINPASVDLQPRPAVEHARTPAADLGDLTGPADVTQRLRVKVTSVVDREIPVAVRPVRALGPRPAEGDSLHSR